MNFIPRADTIAYTDYTQLNDVVRTVPFQLNQNSEFYFSNLYYTLYGEVADTALTEIDAVSFRVELVDQFTQTVVGTFDDITYNKNNLEKYENISYQVNCSNIQPGEYYLRLVTTAVGSTEYNLANVQTSTSNLAKKNYETIFFDGKGLPEEYSLEQNYPNPFNPTTLINYQIPKDGLVTIKVYDIIGKEVTTLVNETKSVGRYSINFDGSNLASGVYIYQLRSGDFVSSKKMMLIK
ncbi:MAG: T9SS type A sorting domain-containing protein [Ignavibacteriales bacterium]|nr:MAG: T9SS type A sorting domain-containing protein [Ignavibacteriales bacterium]